MTALRQVQSHRPPAVPVVELTDLTEIGAPLGLKCRILMLPGLADLIDATGALLRFRGVLLATTGDRSLELLRAVTLRGEPQRLHIRPGVLEEGRQFVARVRAGLSGVSEGGRMLALHVDGKQGPMMVLFLLSMTPDFVPVLRDPALILTSVDGIAADPLLAWQLAR